MTSAISDIADEADVRLSYLGPSQWKLEPLSTRGIDWYFEAQSARGELVEAVTIYRQDQLEALCRTLRSEGLSIEAPDGLPIKHAVQRQQQTVPEPLSEVPSAPVVAAKSRTSRSGGGNAGMMTLTIGLATAMAVGFASFVDGLFEPRKLTPTEQAAADRERAENERLGLHCLSIIDGSHARLVASFKSGLRDPSSFEHVETRITPVRDDGFHHLSMAYRAKNGFGGLTLGTVSANVRPDCSFVITGAE